MTQIQNHDTTSCHETLGDDMEKIALNTELGTLQFYQRGKRGKWWIDIVFTNLNELSPKDRRLRCSTGTNKLEQLKQRRQ